MARARNIKPSIFKNELLGVLDPLITLLFQSLWCLADKSGRLEDRPLRIKAETFPYRENIDIHGYLTELARGGFICRYESGGVRYIQVINFAKHQSPHKTEKASVIPAPTEEDLAKSMRCGLTCSTPLDLREETAALPPDLLIPDSLIPDSGFTDSPIPDSVTPTVASLPAVVPAKAAQAETQHQAACRAVWMSYALAYRNRYGIDPVRNAKVNTQIKQLVTRLGADAQYVAGFYVEHNNSFYVRATHSLDPLVKDCEALRTQWATGNRVTNAKAIEADRLQTQGDGWAALISEAKEAANAQ